MTNPPNAATLRRAADLAEQIERLQRELQLLLSGGSAPSTQQPPARLANGSAAVPAKTRKTKRTMSPEARERIAAAQRARWAKQKKAAKSS